jgi:hypothetical protein
MCPPEKRGNAIGGRTRIEDAHRQRVVNNRIGTNDQGTSTLDSLFVPTQSGVVVENPSDALIAHNIIKSAGDGINVKQWKHGNYYR